mmetsp:Transcript_31127/g.80021  ORF Transcript_31127/g.80021 Transcript_31127/m.80021 type:complete len:249 (-) Transcript_31127:68-814(-)
MADRFYPVGLAAEADAWKTTYEEMNDMRSFARSAYPPGTSIHLPGTRQTFGYSAPGPLRHRLANPELHPTEEVDVPNPREHHARARIQIDDDRETFAEHDFGELLQSPNSRMATALFNRSMGSNAGSQGSRTMARSRSMPSVSMGTRRTSQPPEQVRQLEDDHFSYFVPRSMQAGGAAKLNTHMMSKLQKNNKISFPFSGEGTGFRSQSGLTEVFPKGSYKGITTTQKSSFSKPTFCRFSPFQEDRHA